MQPNFTLLTTITHSFYYCSLLVFEKGNILLKNICGNMLYNMEILSFNGKNNILSQNII